MAIETVITELEAELNIEITKKQQAEKKITGLTKRLEKFRRLRKGMTEDTEFAARITVG